MGGGCLDLTAHEGLRPMELSKSTWLYLILIKAQSSCAYSRQTIAYPYLRHLSEVIVRFTKLPLLEGNFIPSLIRSL
jgi:hypothetical protein